jgi:hypothetical protein
MTNTEKRIRALIDSVEPKYQDFWRRVVSFKAGEYENDLLNDLMHFQDDLASCLFAISEEYLKTTKQRKSLMRNSKKLPHAEVQSQKKDFDKCLDALKGLIYMGKSIGDAYAWFFYYHDREMLNKHLEAQEQLLPPVGKLGGMGELSFVKNVKMLNGYITVYHGITNILRIGDVSLIDSKTLKLVALAEIKTKMKNEDEATLSLHAFGYNSRGFDATMRLSQSEQVEPPKLETENNEHEQRLKVQIEAMLSSLSQSEKTESNDRKNIVTGSYLDHLSDAIIENTTPGKLTYHKADDGLLFIVFRSPHAALSDRLFSQLDPSQIDGNEFIKALMSITDTNTRENSRINGSIHYGKDGVNLHPGTKPIFWHPINDGVLKQIYLQKVTVMTIFNPHFLIKEMAKDGFSLQYVEEVQKKCFVKPVDKGQLVLENFSYFFPLISNHLFQISDVKALINQYHSIVQEKELAPGTKIQYRIFQE